MEYKFPTLDKELENWYRKTEQLKISHFIICENMFGNCVFDAAYSDLVDRKEEISNNNGYRIAAVITKIIINREWKQSEHIEDEFELLSDIILRIL